MVLPCHRKNSIDNYNIVKLVKDRCSFLLQIAFLLTGFMLNSQPVELDLAKYVNPMIGTQNMGHTFPGATVPFGMVQLSPETGNEPMFIDGVYNKDVYRYCSGYQYNDTVIYGFSHTHFSGTGHSDLGDFLVLPTLGKLVTDPDSGAYSTFSHKNANVSP